jgi:multisubunit Na+/H+ antiporter MnhC subunit
MNIVIWVAIGLLVFIGLFLIKMEHHARKVKVIFIVLVGLLLYFSIVSIFSSEKVDLTSPKGVVNAVYVYFGWIGTTIGNLWDIGADTAHTVGNAIKINNTK